MVKDSSEVKDHEHMKSCANEEGKEFQLFVWRTDEMMS